MREWFVYPTFSSWHSIFSNTIYWVDIFSFTQKDNAEEETIDVIGYDEQDDTDWLNERHGRQTETSPGKYGHYKLIAIVRLHTLYSTVSTRIGVSIIVAIIIYIPM